VTDRRCDVDWSLDGEQEGISGVTGQGDGSGSSSRGQLGRAGRIAGFVITAVGMVLVAVSPNPPVTLQHWIQVVGGALLAAFPTAFALHEARWPDWLPGPPDPPDWRRILRAVGVGLVLAAVVAFGVPPAWDAARGAWLRQYGCPPTTQLRMVASPETVTTANELAAAYERWTAGQDHECPTVDVYVYSGTTQEIRERMQTVDGWGDESGALRDLGPRPDVWLAATSHELAGLPPQIVETSPVALSPVVLAVPTALAEREAAGREPWAEVFRRLAEQDAGVIRADPGSTELGLLATALLYGGTGQNGSPSPQQLAPAEVEQRIAESLDEGGFPLTDTLGLLCRHRTRGSQAAVIASEQQVVRFNLGASLGDSCLSGTDDPARLVALYPSDTRSLDHQFVRLSWSEPPQEQAAAAFGEWLRSDAGRDAIVATGLRPLGPHPVASALTTAGIAPAVPAPAEPIPAEQWDATTVAYDAAQRRGRVLFALDTSGSMAAAGPEGPRSTVAAGAISAALEDMGPRDQFGIWFFPDAAGTAAVEAVPLGPRDPARLTAAQQALFGARPAGNTPLFRTMIDAAAALDPDDPTHVDAVVVVTDGEDTSSGIGVDAVRAALAESGVRVIVIAIGEIRCSGSGLTVITTATGGECYDATLADLETTVDVATAGLWGGR
jgi:Ca-activated chloride channel homolog